MRKLSLINIAHIKLCCDCRLERPCANAGAWSVSLVYWRNHVLLGHFLHFLGPAAPLSNLFYNAPRAPPPTLITPRSGLPHGPIHINDDRPLVRSPRVRPFVVLIVDLGLRQYPCSNEDNRSRRSGFTWLLSHSQVRGRRIQWLQSHPRPHCRSTNSPQRDLLAHIEPLAVALPPTER